jgi:glycosyltransferase EpsF
MAVLRLWSKRGGGHLDFVATSGDAGIFDEEARQLGAQVHYLRYGRAHLPQFAGEFRRVLRGGKYDAIHDHQDYASGWHFLMGGDTLPPVRVTHVHNPSYQIRNNYGVTMSRRMTAQIGKRLIAHYATHITGTSRQVIREYGFDGPTFARIPKAVLHCGFHVERFRGNSADAKASICQEFGWPQEARIILFVGRMDESAELGHPRNHKNSAFAVSVGIECVRNDQRVRMLLAGASSGAVPVLEERIAAAGLKGCIRFLNIRKDIERLMIGSDVLLFPSRGEGLGMAAVEAQAAGLPVLAADTVPRECVVVPGLVRFKDVEAGAVSWAVELLQLAARPRDLPSANRQVAASVFAIEGSSRAMLRLYGEAVRS